MLNVSSVPIYRFLGDMVVLGCAFRIIVLFVCLYKYTCRNLQEGYLYNILANNLFASYNQKYMAKQKPKTKTNKGDDSFHLGMYNIYLCQDSLAISRCKNSILICFGQDMSKYVYAVFFFERCLKSWIMS